MPTTRMPATTTEKTTTSGLAGNLIFERKKFMLKKFTNISDISLPDANLFKEAWSLIQSRQGKLDLRGSLTPPGFHAITFDWTELTVSTSILDS